MPEAEPRVCPPRNRIGVLEAGRLDRLSGKALRSALPWTLLLALVAALSLQDIHSLDYW